MPLTPLFGAESVEGNYESYLGAVAVMGTGRACPEPFDARHPGKLWRARQGGPAGILEVPVVDITEATAVTTAGSLIRMGLSTPKARTYAAPRQKGFRNWPPLPA